MPETTDLTIPARVGHKRAFTSATHLWFAPDLTLDEWASLRPQFDFADRGLPWWHGDWYNAGEARFQGFAQYLPETEWARSTLMNRARVCAAFPPGKRRAGLTLSHHAEVYSLEEALRERFLNLAEEHEWSCATLRAEVQKIKAHVEEHTSGASQAQSDYLPLDLPVQWQQLASVAEEHLDPVDLRSLHTAIGVLLTRAVDEEADWHDEEDDAPPPPAEGPVPDDDPFADWDEDERVREAEAPAHDIEGEFLATSGPSAREVWGL